MSSASPRTEPSGDYWERLGKLLNEIILADEHRQIIRLLTERVEKMSTDVLEVKPTQDIEWNEQTHSEILMESREVNEWFEQTTPESDKFGGWKRTGSTIRNKQYNIASVASGAGVDDSERYNGEFICKVHHAWPKVFVLLFRLKNIATQAVRLYDLYNTSMAYQKGKYGDILIGAEEWKNTRDLFESIGIKLEDVE